MKHLLEKAYQTPHLFVVLLAVQQHQDIYVNKK